MLKAIAIFESGGGGSGTVTSVSVASANGFAGSVANASTTPAITLRTTITGIIKGNGTALSAATGDVDYQNPISLTTVGSSGVATFSGDTLNVPNYTYTLPTNVTKRDITFALDGQGSVISAGGTWYLSNIPYAGTITGWCLVADVIGSIVIDVWKANAAVPTVSNTITASALPTLSSAQSAFGGSIAGWTGTAISANDVFAFHVNSASTLTKVSLTIQVTTT